MIFAILRGISILINIVVNNISFMDKYVQSETKKQSL